MEKKCGQKADPIQSQMISDQIGINLKQSYIFEGLTMNY